MLLVPQYPGGGPRCYAAGRAKLGSLLERFSAVLISAFFEVEVGTSGDAQEIWHDLGARCRDDQGLSCDSTSWLATSSHLTGVC